MLLFTVFNSFMPLWDTDNTRTPVPTLPCADTQKHTHKGLMKMKITPLVIVILSTLTDAGKSREKYISQVSLAAVMTVFFTCSSTGSIFRSTPCLAVTQTDTHKCQRGAFALEHLQEEQTDYRTELSFPAFHPE